MQLKEKIQQLFYETLFRFQRNYVLFRAENVIYATQHVFMASTQYILVVPIFKLFVGVFILKKKL